MAVSCKYLDQLSAEGKWDDVFNCLRIDVNSTIELVNMRAPQNVVDDSWLDEHKATANSLEVILAVILLCDQIFYLILIWYLLLFAFKIARYRGLELLEKSKTYMARQTSLFKQALGFRRRTSAASLAKETGGRND